MPLLYLPPGVDPQSSWLDGDKALVISLVVVVILGGLLAVLLGAATQAEDGAEGDDRDRQDGRPREGDGREP